MAENANEAGVFHEGGRLAFLNSQVWIWFIDDDSMKNIEEFNKYLYLLDAYITMNPSLHEEDSPWKMEKIIPLVDMFVRYVNKQEINLLDVGGGAGLILNSVAKYFEVQHSIYVTKYAVDLSPGMLQVQKERNPDLAKALNEDIRYTSLADKEIDLTLMIDLLEHVPNPAEALEEAKRISRFIIFKVPLENNLLAILGNIASISRRDEVQVKRLVHINTYQFHSLRKQIEDHTGRILNFSFTNACDYFRNSEHFKNKVSPTAKLINLIGAYTYKISPRLCSAIFGDFVVILVKCY